MSQNPMHKDPWQRRKNLFSPSTPKSTSQEKSKWRILSVLWQALKRSCTFLGACVLLFALVGYFNFSSVVNETEFNLPNKIVLHLELDGQMNETVQKASLSDPFAEQPILLKDFIDAIERAKYDPRVKGIYAEIDGKGYSLAHLMEIRRALDDFKESGKFTYLYTTSLGDGIGGFYLAQAFDQVWMQPMGVVNITGISMQVPYLRSLLDKVGVEPNFYQRKEYKAAYEGFTNKQMSAANRESMTKIIKDISSIISAQLAQDLDISEAEFKALIDKAIFLDHEALELGLVDKLAYLDEMAEEISGKVQASAHEERFYVAMRDYVSDMNSSHGYQLNVMRPGFRKAPDMSKRIAVIAVDGQIIQDNERKAAGYVGGNEIASALRSAAEDKTIAAVVLRVNSPGGSPVASETILRAVQLVKDAGKPVIVSMGAMAASGGYWVSTLGDYIYASPMTLTGSIGVLGGKVSIQGLLRDLGINIEYVNWGENAAMWSFARPFTQGEEQQISKMLDNIYDRFTQRVAQGRGLSPEKVEEIARGRPWTGIEAQKIGLVDELGSFNDALDYAAQKIGLSDRFEAELVILPKPLTRLELFIELLEGQVHASAKLQEVMQVLEPYLSLAEAGASQINQGEVFQAYEPMNIEP